MWVRAVTAAVAAWCVSGAAMAAGYAEVWNPPEATAHSAPHAKKTAAGLHGGSKVGSRTVSKHGGQQAASSSKNGNKAAAHGGMNTVTGNSSGKNAAKSPVKPTRKKPAVMVQSKKPRTQMAQANVGGAKAVHANLAQGHKTSAHALAVAGKSGGAAKPAVSQMAMTAVPMGSTASSNAGTSLNAAHEAVNPATASSGSLPPILH